MKTTALTLSIYAVLAPSSEAQTLRDAARLSAPGPVAMLTMCDCPEVTLEQLTSTADLIVQGTVRPLQTYLSPDEKELLTDYLVVPTRILLQRAAQTSGRPGPAAAITLTRRGGTTLIEGVQVSFVDQQVAPLIAGAEYILFLRLDKERSDTFRDVNERVGTWSVEKGLVRLLGEAGMHGETFARVRGIPIDRLEAELRRTPEPTSR